MTITVPSYLVTLPARNEETRLVSAVQRVDGMLQQLGHPYTLLIAEDGSTDNTFKVAKGLVQAYPNLKLIHSDSKLGRGRALRNAWKSTLADVYVFMDADLATDLRFLPKLVSRMQSEGLDFVTGSRYSPGSSLRRPLLRKMFSLAYNAIVQALFITDISDHQCGFKAFSRRAVMTVLPLTRENGWAWDTEVIVYLKNLGWKMAEMPVSWKEMKSKRTPIKRLVMDISEQGPALVRILVRSRRLKANPLPGHVRPI
jgi:glycosyltransferase involved in cell wall biosynthesis